MNLKKENINQGYTPVAYEYKEITQEQIDSQRSGKIFYFCDSEGICEQSGSISELADIPSQGVFVVMAGGERIRMDRIITLFGKPGAAYDEYDAYGNACMSCTGGYEPEDL